MPFTIIPWLRGLKAAKNMSTGEVYVLPSTFSASIGTQTTSANSFSRIALAYIPAPQKVEVVEEANDDTVKEVKVAIPAPVPEPEIPSIADVRSSDVTTPIAEVEPAPEDDAVPPVDAFEAPVAEAQSDATDEEPVTETQTDSEATETPANPSVEDEVSKLTEGLFSDKSKKKGSSKKAKAPKRGSK